jgi:hypothetical protein
LIQSVHKLDDRVKAAATRGRRYGLDMGFTAAGGHRINNTLRDQITELVAFRTVGNRALDYLKEFFSTSELEEIKILPDHHFWWVDLSSGAKRRGESSL